MPAPPASDEFYVGYLQERLPRTRRLVRAAVLALSLTGVGFGVAMVASQRSPGDAVWHEREASISGVVVLRPYPMVRSRGAGQPAVLVVATGKHGARDRLARHEGAVVTLRGTRLARDGRFLFELADGGDAITPLPGTTRVVPPEVLGRVTVRGEVIDPKCYMGAMKPGSGKTHRACAVRCIAGGIPPMLVAREAGSTPEYYLLADEHGGAVNERVLPWVGDVVDARGTLVRDDGVLVLRLDPGGLTRR